MAKASKRAFNYQKRTVNDVQGRANARGGDFDTIFKSKYKVYKVKDGKNLLRILPPTWDKAKHYGYDIWVNYGIGPDNQSYLSLSKMLKEKDPLADARRAADKEGDEDVTKALQPRQRIVMWVIDRDNEDEGPQLWGCPVTVDKDLANISVDEDTNEVVLIDSPDEGTDFRFHREGKGLKTKYPAAKMRLMKPSTLHDDPEVEKQWLDYVQDNPIPECLQYYDYKHIADAFGGSVRTDSDDDDRPAKAKASRSRDEEEDEAPPPRRRAAPRDEPADEDDVPWEGRKQPAAGKRPAREPEPEDEETEDEPPPRRATAKPGRRAEPEPEDDPPPRARARTASRPEPEDEPEEEAPPRRTAAKRPARDEPEEEPDDPPPRRLASRRPPAEEPEDEVDDADDTTDRVKPGGLRDRLAQRRASGGKNR